MLFSRDLSIFGSEVSVILCILIKALGKVCSFPCFLEHRFQFFWWKGPFGFHLRDLQLNHLKYALFKSAQRDHNVRVDSYAFLHCVDAAARRLLIATRWEPEETFFRFVRSNCHLTHHQPPRFSRGLRLLATPVSGCAFPNA